MFRYKSGNIIDFLKNYGVEMPETLRDLTRDFVEIIRRPSEVKTVLAAINKVESTYGVGGRSYSYGWDTACKAAKEKAKREPHQITNALTVQNWQADDVALYLIANVCSEALWCGRNHIYRGVLSGVGEGYLSVYSQSLRKLTTSGFFTEEQATEELRTVRQSIKEAG